MMKGSDQKQEQKARTVYRQFDQQFKEDAVSMWRQKGKNAAVIARDLGISAIVYTDGNGLAVINPVRP